MDEVQKKHTVQRNIAIFGQFDDREREKCACQWETGKRPNKFCVQEQTLSVK